MIPSINILILNFENFIFYLPTATSDVLCLFISEF